MRSRLCFGGAGDVVVVVTQTRDHGKKRHSAPQVRVEVPNEDATRIQNEIRNLDLFQAGVYLIEKYGAVELSDDGEEDDGILETARFKIARDRYDGR